MKLVNVVQGSSDWLALKTGRITATRIAKVLAKHGSETRERMKREIVAERLTETITTTYVSDAMQWGVDNEPLARTAYEMRTGNDVKLIGFVLHPTIEWAGCSPDGCIGKDGLFEAKCPQTTTHIDYLIAKKVPAEYVPQVQWQLAVTERDWCDFTSFDPRLPQKHQLLIVRMWRDEKRIKEMNDAVIQFLAEVDDLVHQLEAGENYYIEQLTASIAAANNKLHA